MQAHVAIAVLSAAALFGQVAEPTAKFEIADVHVSPKTPGMFPRGGPVRGGRFEFKNATMVDLIRSAYGFDPDKILGGPNWLEMDRFDVTAKVSADSTPDTQKLMQQSLLSERFSLKVHKDTKPLPVYALIAGKKPQLKETDGSGTPGCKPEEAGSGPQVQGNIRLFTGGGNGSPASIQLGPGMTVHFICRNMTMAAFAGGMRGMMGANVGTNPVIDETGLKGAWNFDVRWSIQMNGGMMAGQGDRITIFEAMEKQLGLKLEERQVPTPVLVVDSVNRAPSPNSPETAVALPPLAMPTEFEVADVKATGPDSKMMSSQLQPGGHFVSKGFPMRFLLMRAFGLNTNEALVGLPKWGDSDRFDINAKAAMPPGVTQLDMEAVGPPLKALLVDRFKLKYHMEDKPVTTYVLVSGKPKMKKADPASRSWCRQLQAPAGTAPGSRVFSCQNVTMEQFADRLMFAASWLNWPVLDATGLEGGWDLSLTYSQTFPAGFMGPGPGRGGDAAIPGADVPSAADPNGASTIFEAVEKQLGLKLEARKRPMPVVVIDQIEQKPTEN